MFFRDRKDAGVQLAARLSHFHAGKDIIVLAPPRGGVTVGHEIARALACPLDIIIIRKLGFPGQPELAIGAVSETGSVVLNENIIALGGVTEEFIEKEITREREEIARRKVLYRGGKGIPQTAGKTVIITDDGVATGATLKAAISALKEEKPVRLVAAMPVSPQEAEAEISAMVDEWVCLHTPEGFLSIGSYYEDFTQVSDDEVVKILRSPKPL
jgi:putative phosphoribosyl transferase